MIDPSAPQSRFEKHVSIWDTLYLLFESLYSCSKVWSLIINQSLHFNPQIISKVLGYNWLNSWLKWGFRKIVQPSQNIWTLKIKLSIEIIHCRQYSRNLNLIFKPTTLILNWFNVVHGQSGSCLDQKGVLCHRSKN